MATGNSIVEWSLGLLSSVKTLISVHLLNKAKFSKHEVPPPAPPVCTPTITSTSGGLRCCRASRLQGLKASRLQASGVLETRKGLKAWAGFGAYTNQESTLVLLTTGMPCEADQCQQPFMC